MSSPPEGANPERLLAWGREVVRAEAEALAALAGRLDGSFARAVAELLACLERRGRVVVTGLGKSGLVGRRLSATLNSLGTPSLYLHPVEAAHGDLGVLQPQDLALALSQSGETREVVALCAEFGRLRIPILAFTGDVRSSLAREARVTLDCSVRSEACALGLAPTSSSALQSALGDALAVAVFRARGLSEADFAFRHPGGALGRRLSLRVRDVMHAGDAMPRVRESERVAEAILEIMRKRLGMTVVVDEAGGLAGVLADGDLKRLLHRHRDIMELTVGEVMTRSPRTIEPDAPLTRALARMEEDPGRLITSLVVLAENGVPAGVIHLHDCLQAGLA